MTDEDRIKILTDALEKVWNELGRIVLEISEPLPPLVYKIKDIADEVGEALNDANPELEGLHGPSRGLYSPYQPLEVVRFITKTLEEGSAKPKIKGKILSEYTSRVRHD